MTTPSARGKLPKTTLLGLFILVALGLWVYYASVVNPLFQNVLRLRTEARSAATELQHVQQAVDQEEQLRELAGTLSSEVERFRTGLPPVTNVLSVVERFSQLANQSGVKIQTIAPQRVVDLLPVPAATKDKAKSKGKSKEKGRDPAPPPPPSLYREIAIQVDAVAGFHQLGTFLSLIESSPQPMQVRALHMTQNAKEPRRHVIKMTVIGFFSAS